MKLFAIFLPQFHEIPENNEWWGNGFTEWTNVKKALPLFADHIQPKHPLNNNYYNLLNKNTVMEQTSLMKKYGITGMVYYHYYFCGRLLLEKPAENLLKWTDIDQPFFFCWANHSWKKTWNGTSEVLLEQTYGTVEDWKKHFKYLLPFFLDSRYEKKENKPVFMIYNPNFEEKKDMLEYFDKWCKEIGFDGIFSIDVQSMPSRLKDNNSKRTFWTEPQSGKMRTYYSNIFKRAGQKIVSELNRIGVTHKVQKFNGTKIYKNMIKNVNSAVIPGIFFEWDNTPRHGYRGYIITPPEKKVFFEYMNKIRNSEYAIINAWNEWAEGMALEPSEELGTRYLEWIKEWKESNINREEDIRK